MQQELESDVDSFYSALTPKRRAEGTKHVLGALPLHEAGFSSPTRSRESPRQVSSGNVGDIPGGGGVTQLAGSATPLAGSETQLGSPPHTPSWGRRVAAGHKCLATPTASEAASVHQPGSERVGAGSGGGGGSPVPSGWWAAAAVASQDVIPSRLLLRGTPFTASEGDAPDHPGNSGDVGGSGATPSSDKEALPDPQGGSGATPSSVITGIIRGSSGASPSSEMRALGHQGGNGATPPSSVITGIIRGFQMDRLSHAVSSAVASPVAVKGEEVPVSRSDRLHGGDDVTAGSGLIVEAASGCSWSLNPTFGGVIGSVAAASSAAGLGVGAYTGATKMAVGCSSSAAPAATLAAGEPTASSRCDQVLEVLLGSQWSDVVGWAQPHTDPAHQQDTPAAPSVAIALARGRIHPVFETLRAPLAAIADPVGSDDMADTGSSVSGLGVPSTEAALPERDIGGGQAGSLLDPGSCSVSAACSPAPASSCDAARSGRSGSQKQHSTGSSRPTISRVTGSPLIYALQKILLDQ